MVLRLGIAAYRTVLELGPGQTADLSHLDRTDFSSTCKRNEGSDQLVNSDPAALSSLGKGS